MFGDKESVVNTASVLHSRLHKRHNALSYHKTREAIATGITHFTHIDGERSLTGVVSKHWDDPSVRDTLHCILFWGGDTGNIPKYLAGKYSKP